MLAIVAKKTIGGICESLDHPLANASDVLHFDGSLPRTGFSCIDGSETGRRLVQNNGSRTVSHIQSQLIPDVEKPYMRDEPRELWSCNDVKPTRQTKDI